MKHILHLKAGEKKEWITSRSNSLEGIGRRKKIVDTKVKRQKWETYKGESREQGLKKLRAVHLIAWHEDSCYQSKRVKQER